MTVAGFLGLAIFWQVLAIFWRVDWDKVAKIRHFLASWNGVLTDFKAKDKWTKIHFQKSIFKNPFSKISKNFWMLKKFFQR